MNNDKLKFVVDSRSFDGSCVTTMSDGIHGDYHHETLEELRDREKNPYLIAVSGNTVRKMIRIHLQSLCAPFSEITEERYFDYMDVLPPIRHTRNFFFLGEPYHADIYRFCFRAGGRYFTGLRSVTTPRKELERQMDNHYRNITFKGDILKEKPMVISDHARHASIIIVPYLFLDINGEKKFICNLMRGTDESSGRDVRLETAKILRSLRRHHFLYFSGYEGNDDMDKFLGEVMKKKHTLLANGNFLQYPVNRESVSFTGTVRETGEPFFFRIYDRELFLHLLYVLRGIKREKAKIETDMGRQIRKSKGKTMKPNFFVFCEGESEVAYISHLRSQYRAPIQIMPRKSDSNISVRYIENCKREYVVTKNDKTFLMFDLDVDGMLEHLLSIPDAILMVSNPCIELWYLLHFEKCHAELTQNVCIKKLKRHLEHYTKGTLALNEKQQLSEKTSEATARAKMLDTYNNPSTTIYKMIELLESL